MVLVVAADYAGLIAAAHIAGLAKPLPRAGDRKRAGG